MSTEPNAAPSGAPEYLTEDFPESVFLLMHGHPATVYANGTGHVTFVHDDSPELRAALDAWRGPDGQRFRLQRHATQVLRGAVQTEQQRVKEAAEQALTPDQRAVRYWLDLQAQNKIKAETSGNPLREHRRALQAAAEKRHLLARLDASRRAQGGEQFEDRTRDIPQEELPELYRSDDDTGAA